MFFVTSTMSGASDNTAPSAQSTDTDAVGLGLTSFLFEHVVVFIGVSVSLKLILHISQPFFLCILLLRLFFF